MAAATAPAAVVLMTTTAAPSSAAGRRLTSIPTRPLSARHPRRSASLSTVVRGAMPGGYLQGSHASSPRAGRQAMMRRALAKASETKQTDDESRGPGSQPSLTKKIFDEVDARGAGGAQAGGAGGATTYEGLKRVDKVWEAIRNQPTGADAGPCPQFVTEDDAPLLKTPELDVVVCGGTLGIFMATVLQLRGFKVAVVERGPLGGRSQDWNISWKEVQEVVDLGVLTDEEARDAVNIEFNPIRAVFHGAEEEAVWTKNVLNLGVSPAKLMSAARKRFEESGGTVLEKCGVQGMTVHPNGAVLHTEGDDVPSEVATRLVLDCMGHGSPVTRQLRWGRKPDGMCLVVGACARGAWPDNSTADIIATASPLQPADAPVTNLQYFWEAFPAGSGPEDRTTYMFTYLDAEPHRPSLESLFDDYWRLMPEYQGVELEDLQMQRLLFGFFPTFRDSPLQPGWDRVLQVGDASGIQSPLSFGGFGALTRHLDRISTAVSEALDCNALNQEDLKLINAYNPGLSGAWMLQKAMSVRPGETPDPQFVNKLLSTNFTVMNGLGEKTLKPFLQDVVQFKGLASTMAGQMVKAPMFVPEIVANVGILPVLDWSKHFLALGYYGALTSVLERPLKSLGSSLSPKEQYRLNRRLDAWRYGAGLDYK